MTTFTFILGSIFGILIYIYVPKIASRFNKKIGKDYEVTFTIMYLTHPKETNKKGEYVRMKPISIRVKSVDDEDAVDFANDIIYDNIKVEIDSVEEC